MKTVHTNMKLYTFVKADTHSKKVGQIKEGTFTVIKILKSHPNSSTDYIKIVDPYSGDNVWICSRYKNTIYALVNEEIDKTSYNFEDDTFAIDEIELTKLLPYFYNFSYNLKNARYPYTINGCELPQSPPMQNNCCTFIEALLVKSWQNVNPDFEWNNKLHSQMMISSYEIDYFSPVKCLIDQNMAIKVDNDDSIPQPWTVIQGWKKQWSGGHTFLIIDHHINTDRILTLESNSYYLLNGVGYRMIGALSESPNPTKEWWKNDNLWTWEKVKSTYKFRKQAKLKVKNIHWIS